MSGEAGLLRHRKAESRSSGASQGREQAIRGGARHQGRRKAESRTSEASQGREQGFFFLLKSAVTSSGPEAEESNFSVGNRRVYDLRKFHASVPLANWLPRFSLLAIGWQAEASVVIGRELCWDALLAPRMSARLGEAGSR